MNGVLFGLFTGDKTNGEGSERTIRLNSELSPIEKKDPDPNICNIKENKRTFKSVYI